MKLKNKLNSFLTNKLVLNMVFVFSLLNITGYIMIGRIDDVIFFILTALLIGFFNKNMIIVLGVPLILVNLMAVSNKSLTEGFNANNKVKGSKNKAVKNKTDEKERIDKDKKKMVEQKQKDSFEVGRADKYNIDYAATVEDAYDELSNILGGDGIKRLTDDTRGLIGQQMELTNAIKGMGPLMESMGPMIAQAEGLMNKMNPETLKSLKGMTSKLN